MIFAGLLLFLPLLLLLNTVLNRFFLSQLSNEEIYISDSLTVLIPLRNEEGNVEKLVDALMGQRGLPKFRVIFINDNSTDRTAPLLRQSICDDQRFLLIDGNPLPAGWLGKPFALHQGFQISDSDLLVLIDADVRLKPYAIAQAATLLRKKNLDFLSAYPQEIALTWSERIIQPLLQWSWMATLPLKIAERSSNPAFAVANGQFFLVRRNALELVGGFESVRSKVIDDIELARALLRSGFHGTVADGSRVATCRMYESWDELRNGYSKSLPSAFGGFFGTWVVLAFLFITGVLPILLALMGSVAGLSACLLVYFSRFTSARATGGRSLDVIAHPFSSILLIFLIARSWRLRGRVMWKGRIV